MIEKEICDCSRVIRWWRSQPSESGDMSQTHRGGHILNTPNRMSGIRALSAADSASASYQPV